MKCIVVPTLTSSNIVLGKREKFLKRSTTFLFFFEGSLFGNWHEPTVVEETPFWTKCSLRNFILPCRRATSDRPFHLINGICLIF